MPVFFSVARTRQGIAPKLDQLALYRLKLGFHDLEGLVLSKLRLQHDPDEWVSWVQVHIYEKFPDGAKLGVQGLVNLLVYS